MAYYLKFVFGNVLVDKKYQDRNIQVEAPKCEDIALLEYYKEYFLYFYCCANRLFSKLYKDLGTRLKKHMYVFIYHIISPFYSYKNQKKPLYIS